MLSGAWGCIKRPIPKLAREYPEAAHLLWRPDFFGLDSAYDGLELQVGGVAAA